MAAIVRRKIRGKISEKWYIRYTDSKGVRNWRVGYSDRALTKQLARDIENEIARASLETGKPENQQAKKTLEEHISDYLSDLTARGRDKTYVYITGLLLRRIAEDCGWIYWADVNQDSFVSWRAKQSAKSARSKNQYLGAVKSFGQWLFHQGRIESNPIWRVQQVEQRGNEVRVRRALLDAEVQALLAASGEFRALYTVALTTGLRKGELSQLQWHDIDLEKRQLTVRASTSKNHRQTTLPLHQSAIDQLSTLPTGEPTDKVFPVMPNRRQWASHLAAAGIASKDKMGRVVDFHSLRHTFITNLSRHQVEPRMAMALARHSDIGLTMRVYTDTSALNRAGAVARLPGI